MGEKNNEVVPGCARLCPVVPGCAGCARLCLVRGILPVELREFVRQLLMIAITINPNHTFGYTTEMRIRVSGSMVRFDTQIEIPMYVNAITHTASMTPQYSDNSLVSIFFRSIL